MQRKSPRIFYNVHSIIFYYYFNIFEHEKAATLIPEIKILHKSLKDLKITSAA